MANVIDIVVRATDQSGGGLNTLNSQFQKLTGFSLSAAGAIGMAGKALDTLYKFVRDSVNETEKYVTSITDMSRVLGMSTEETSRLVQASDDLFVSQEKLQTALLAATRQGIDVSTEGLKKLSDEYLSLNAGAERGQFLMRTFGRSGADMGKLMEVGADGIQDATDAIEDNLIVTAQSKASIENYKRSLDNLNDSWMGIKYTVGNVVIPQLDLLFRALADNNTETEKMHLNLRFLIDTLELDASFVAKLAGVTEEQVLAFRELDSTTTDTNESLNNLATITSDTSDYFKELTTQMIYNIAAAGLDQQAAINLGIEMGILNVGTMAAYNSLKTANEYLAGNEQAIYQYAAAYNALWQALQNVQSASDIQSQLTGIGLGGGGGGGGAGTQTAGGTQVGGTKPNGWVQIGTVSWSDLTPVYAPPKATGGYAAGGHPYLVGERGPELFTPSGGGQITPNGQLTGGSATISQADMMYLGKIIASEIQKAIG